MSAKGRKRKKLFRLWDEAAKRAACVAHRRFLKAKRLGESEKFCKTPRINNTLIWDYKGDPL